MATTADDATALAELSHPALNSLSRMGERIAALEAKHESLKGDTEVIRTSIHAINGELQRMVIADQNFLNSLTNLTTQVGRLVEAAPTVYAAISAFEGMRADLKMGIASRGAKITAMAAVNRSLPWIIAGAGLAAWFFDHTHLLVK